MKTFIAFLLIRSVFLSSSFGQKENPVKGFWDMQYCEWKSPDTSFVFRKSEMTRLVKIYGEKHFTWLHQNHDHVSDYPGRTYGEVGTYRISRDTLSEATQLFPWKDNVGIRYVSTFEVRCDTLMLKFPEKENLANGCSGFSIYIRLE